MPLPGKAEALYANHGIDLRLRHHVGFHLFHHGKRALFCRSGRQLDVQVYSALVFCWQKRCRQARIKQDRACNDGAIHAHHPEAALDHPGHHAFIGLGAAGKDAVEPVEERTEEAGFFVVRMPLGNRFEHGGAQRRCEREGKKS